jgi:CubicO group peptidase (beta-lactamase class C family)
MTVVFMRRRLLWIVVPAMALVATWAGRELITWHPEASQLRAASLEDLERELAAMREPLQIPGMSAAIAERGEIIWARGFGLADRERALPANSKNIYHLASLTKPYAAVVVLQLVDEGKLDLDQPVSDFGINLSSREPVRVRHLLSHTSTETPGAVFRYDGVAFGHLSTIVEKITGRTFTAELTDRIIRRLGLTETAPNPRHVDAAPPDDPGHRTFEMSGLDRPFIDAALVTGYGRSMVTRSLVPMSHPTYLFASAGLVASAPDVARFSIALDRGDLLEESTQARAFSASSGPTGKLLPYGLGWFVQKHGGVKVVWHFGQTAESSSLLVKIPEQELTFVVLGNSDGLSRGRRLGDEADVQRSPVAMLFLNWAESRR